MARPFTAKVGRHVGYLTASGKLQSGTIVSTPSGNGGIVVRVGHTTAKGDGTTGITKMTPGVKGGNKFKPSC